MNDIKQMNFNCTYLLFCYKLLALNCSLFVVVDLCEDLAAILD